MSGDYSRDRFHSSKGYHGVRQQQGRVALDADWNEAWDIQDRRWRAETLDLMGRCAVSPETPDAFKIVPLSADGGPFAISPGRIYVDGLLAENFGTGAETFDPVLAETRASAAVPYTKQSDLPDVSPLSDGRYLVYLDVWEREVTHVQDPDLLEPALRGVDTTTRLQTIWQVRTLPLQENADCTASLDEGTAESTGRLSVSLDNSLVTDDPCVLSPTGGYRGAENHLYRVQIHDGGGLSEVPGTENETDATFKWSRDNASTVIPVTSITGRTISLTSLGRDRTTGIGKGDWVEILDDHRELNHQSGDLARVADIDEGAQEITLDRDIPLGRLFATDEQGHLDRHTRLCKWDQSDQLLPNGTLSVDAGPIHLENGVTLAFGTADAGQENAFRAGDYWLFAARPGNAEFGVLGDAPPRGIHHHYCRLAVINVNEGVVEEPIEECRPLMGNPKASCCIVTVGDGIVSQGDFTNDIQAAINAVSPGGKVCILDGTYELSAPILVTQDNLDLSIVGCGKQTRIRCASGFRGGGSLISIEADNIAISDLSLEVPDHCSPRPALGAQAIAGLNIARCSVSSPDRAAISLSTCSDVSITDCELAGYPALLASQCTGIRVENNSVSQGGLWIGTSSASISITRNRITEGRGPGILLGDSTEPSQAIPTPSLGFAVKIKKATLEAPARRVRLFHKEALTEELRVQVEAFTEPGNIQRVQIKDNLIEGMEGSGIATAYHKTLNNPDDIAELDSVDDLEIIGNRILNCVQAEPDCRFPDGSGIGAGILLAGSSNVRIRQNQIANNGCRNGASGQLWPACGIVAGDCAEVDISDNHCVDNGITNESRSSEGEYVQAELALLYVKSTPASRDALRVYNNVVRCKAGQAIIALSTGNMSICGNTLESLSYRAQPLLIRDENLAQNASLKAFLEIITRFSCVLLLQYSGETKPIYSLPALTTVSGNRIVSYHGPAELSGAIQKLDIAFCGASIGILSGGDVSVANNQAWYSQPSGAV